MANDIIYCIATYYSKHEDVVKIMLIVQIYEHNILAAFSTIKNGMSFFFLHCQNQYYCQGGGNLRSDLHNINLSNNVGHPGSVDSQSV